MALSPALVRVGVTGVVSTAALTAAAPSSTSSALTGYADLGLVGEDGMTVTLPDSGDATPIKAWQLGQTVRTVRATSDDSPTISGVLLETSLAVLQEYYGAAVSGQTATDGAFVVDSSVNRPYKRYVVDVVDGAQLKRVFAPYGVISSVGDQVFANQEPIGYEVTISCDRDATLGYNLKIWDTAAKTP